MIKARTMFLKVVTTQWVKKMTTKAAGRDNFKSYYNEINLLDHDLKGYYN